MKWTVYQCDLCKKIDSSGENPWNELDKIKNNFKETVAMLDLLKINHSCKECFNELFECLLNAGKLFLLKYGGL